MPEQQTKRECVVITPRYERTTMNDYWEHTADVENTYKLVESMLKNKWNFGNPNHSPERSPLASLSPGSSDPAMSSISPNKMFSSSPARRATRRLPGMKSVYRFGSMQVPR